MTPAAAPSGNAINARVMFEPSQTPSAPLASEIAVGTAAAIKMVRAARGSIGRRRQRLADLIATHPSSPANALRYNPVHRAQTGN